MIYESDHIYSWWIVLSIPKFIIVCVCILLAHLSHGNSLGGSLLPLGGNAHFVEMSYFVTGFALCILCRTLLPWLVFMFSTSHALAFDPSRFSRNMSRIRRSLVSGCFCAIGFPFFEFFYFSLACSVYGHVEQNAQKQWNLTGSDSCDESCYLLFLIVA